MDKVYVVTSGIYSDYRIERIFTNLEDAEKYCALLNSDLFDERDLLDIDLHWEYECRIEEYQVDNVQFAINEKPMKKRYVYSRYQNEEYFTSCGTIYTNNSFVKVTKYTKEHVRVVVIVDYDMSIDRMKKIVYDEIAKHGAVDNFLI